MPTATKRPTRRITGRSGRFGVLRSSREVYRYEDVPKAFTSDQVQAVLEHIYEDESPAGRRDHAIALLLAHYGFRAGEIARMRL